MKNKSVQNYILKCTHVLLYMCILSFATNSCKKEELKKSELKDILSFSIEQQSDTAIINLQEKLITITAKYNADLTKLAPQIKISEKASIKPELGTEVDFSKGIVIYTVTAEDKTSQEWKVSITKNQEIEKKITSFSVPRATNIQISDSTIVFTILETDSITKLQPTIQITEGSTISPASTQEIDVSKGDILYTLTGSDGSQKKYTIKAVIVGSVKILDFAITGQIGKTSIVKNAIQVIVDPTVDLQTIQPIITLSKYVKVSPEAVANFSLGTVEYTISNEAGDTAKYTVFVTYPLIEGNNTKIQYTGRIDFTNAKVPKFSAPGAYIQAKFKGTFCDIDIKDEFKWGYLNYIEVRIDNEAPVRIKMESKKTIYRVASNLTDGEHTILICKDSEAGIGFLEFRGFRCAQLIDMSAKPSRKIECFGNSITCGAGVMKELCATAVNSKWYISNKAYMSYGAIMARDLNAQYHLSSVSGIGLVKSCCGNTETMPDVYDRLYFENAASAAWDFDNYIPDVVTIALGQNDGVIDSTVFCSAYVKFVNDLRNHYPNASFFCITSPMCDDNLLAFQKKCLTGIVNNLNEAGNNKVYKVYLKNKRNAGCSSHPDENQQIEIANELKAVIKEKMAW